MGKEYLEVVEPGSELLGVSVGFVILLQEVKKEGLGVLGDLN